MGLVANFLVESANNPGNGDVLLLGAIPGRQQVRSAIPDGTQFYYFISDETAMREWGIGTLHLGSPDRVTRDTVIGNSVNTAARMNFTGAVLFYVDVPAERSVYAGGDNSTIDMAGRRLLNLAPATLLSDAPNFGQVGWRVLDEQFAAGSPLGLSLNLPSALTRYRLEWRTLAGTAASGIVYAQVSVDGSALFTDGAGYRNASINVSGAGVSSISNYMSYIQLSPANDASQSSGFIEFTSVGQKAGVFHGTGYDTGASPWCTHGGFSVNSAQVAQKIWIGKSGTTLALAAVRLLGAS